MLDGPQSLDDVVSDGVGGDIEALGNFLMGHVLVTTHAVDPLLLIGKLMYSHFGNVLQVGVVHGFFGVVVPSKRALLYVLFKRRFGS